MHLGIMPSWRVRRSRWGIGKGLDFRRFPGLQGWTVYLGFLGMAGILYGSRGLTSPSGYCRPQFPLGSTKPEGGPTETETLCCHLLAFFTAELALLLTRSEVNVLVLRGVDKCNNPLSSAAATRSGYVIVNKSGWLRGTKKVTPCCERLIRTFFSGLSTGSSNCTMYLVIGPFLHIVPRGTPPNGTRCRHPAIVIRGLV